MKLPQLADLGVKDKKVFVRADLDVGSELTPEDDTRIKLVIPTLKYLVEQGAKIIVLAHRGRPDGKEDAALSLGPVAKRLDQLLEQEWPDDLYSKADINVMENLRFTPGEEANDAAYGKHLAEKADLYVNDAFAASHREHASMVALPKYLPHAAGLHLVQEIDALEKLLNEPKRPVVALISGVKKDKLDYLTGISKFADKILVGGRLPDYMGDPDEIKDPKLLVARLIQDREDITLHSVEQFVAEVKQAGSTLVSGPLGKFEEAGHMQGTKMVLEAIAASSAYKVAGGGDTLAVIQKLGLTGKFDWLCSGGGAMLEFVSTGTLPGIRALLS